MDTYRPDDPVPADLAHEWKSAYVHIPFCRRRCPYCDFAIVDESTGSALGYTEYVDALIAEIGMEEDFGPLDAINLGGGTPSRLNSTELNRLVTALVGRFGLKEGAELSLEVNPEDWTPVYGEALSDIGITRVSIGAQSFDPAVLDALGRMHTAEMIAATVTGARSAGIASVGIDLIFGHPAESVNSWQRTVGEAMELGVDHISTYSLTVEPGTELSKSILSGDPAPDEDSQADRYEHFESVSRTFGFVRYEISNHAQSGHVCRYNLATWAHGEYVAFGVGAHDHRWGTRARNHRRPDRYMEAIARGERPRIGIEQLTVPEQNRDRLMVGLRLAAGTPLTRTARLFLESQEGQRFLEAGILSVDGERLRVIEPMLTDAVIREALSVSLIDC